MQGAELKPRASATLDSSSTRSAVRYGSPRLRLLPRAECSTYSPSTPSLRPAETMTSTPELRSTFVSQKVTDKIAALENDRPFYTFEVCARTTLILGGRGWR